MRRPLWIPWRWWRRAIQLALLVGFVWLFRRTEYSGADILPGGENILFRLDPLVGLTSMLGARQFIAMFWPAMLIAVLTIAFGRFFCGWMCPLGTLLDWFHGFVGCVKALVRSPLTLWERIRSKARVGMDQPHADTTAMEPNAFKRAGRSFRYVVLIVVLVSALFAFPLVGFVDPFSLLVRGLTFWGDPTLYRGVDAAFTWSGEESWASEVVQPFVKKHLLPFRPAVFHLAGVSAGLLGLLFAFELFVPRFWCRYVCPTGSLLGLLSRRMLLRRVPPKTCKNCSHCVAVCRMDAIDPVGGVAPEACTLCMDCVDFCPKGIAKFTVKRTGGKAAAKVERRPVDLSRRAMLTGVAAGVAVPGVALASRITGKSPVPPTLIRPAGVGDEKTFLNLCIRCGECMKVCPTNVLQPAIFDAGLQGVFSPKLVPRLIFEQSYCEYTCTLCGQVCPTGAIPRLTEELKHVNRTAVAWFDHSLCLPWAEKTPCIRCEEMCPAPEKAITVQNTFTIKGPDGEDVEIQQPVVNRDLCVGCGICESNCTIPGVAGIRLQRLDAPDPGTETLLNAPPPKSKS